MTMHLLVETAVEDSLDYEILSIEDLDALKKDQRNLRRRTETLKSKLQLEVKVRDSAQSLFSLFPEHEAATAPTKRRSLLGSRKDSGNSVRTSSFQKAKEELAKSVRTCEDLAKEIWGCDSRQRDLEERQLRHTAGVFQAQHRLLLQEQEQEAAQNGNEARDSFDFRNMVQNGTGRGYDGIMEIPQRHSILGRQIAHQQNDLIMQRDALARTETRLQHFHRRLHSLAVEYSPEVLPQEELEFYATDTPSAIFKHLDHMEQGLATIERAPMRNQEIESTRVKVRELSAMMHGVLNKSVTGQRRTFESQESSDVTSGLLQLENGLHILQEHQSKLDNRIEEFQSKELTQDHEVQRCTDALHRLWDTLVSSEKRLAKLRTPESEGESPFGYDAFDEDQEQGTSFSIASTLTKTQRLCDRAARLYEQQLALRNQFQQEQERSVNSGSTLGAEREKWAKVKNALSAEREELIGELNATRQQHFAGQQAYEHKQSQFDHARAENQQILDALNAEREQHGIELGTARSEQESLSSQLGTHLARIQDLEGALTSHVAGLESAQAGHREAEAARGAALEELDSTRRAHETVVRGLNLQLDGGVAQITDLQESLASYTKSYESMTAAHNEAEALQSSLQKELDTTRNANQESAAQLDAKIAQITNLEGALASCTTNLESLQTAYIEAEASRKAFQAEADSTRKIHEDLATQLEGKIAQISNLEGALASHAANLESMQSAYRDAEASRLLMREHLEERDANTVALQTANETASQSLLEAQSLITHLTETTAQASTRAASLESQISVHTASLASLEAEKSDLEAQLARLATDATLARAELDAAHGTRAQQKHLADLTARNADLTHHVEALKFHGERAEVLERELAELVDEYEVLVQVGVTAERERRELEAALDTVSARAEALEVRLNEERVRGMGRSGGGADNGKMTNGLAGSPKHASRGKVVSQEHGDAEVVMERRMDSTVVGVMRAEFKKMMREARAEHFRSLKVSFLFWISLQTPSTRLLFVPGPLLALHIISVLRSSTPFHLYTSFANRHKLLAPKRLFSKSSHS